MVLTVFCEGILASNHAVHRTVDSLCRHAARAVRDLGARLWTRPEIGVEMADDLRLFSPLAVCERKTCACDSVTPGESYPHTGGATRPRTSDQECGTNRAETAEPREGLKPASGMSAKTPRDACRPSYDSIMCSTREQRIAQIGQAIDDLAAQADSAGGARVNGARANSAAPDGAGVSGAEADGAEASGARTKANAAAVDADQVFLRLAELWAQLAQLDPEVAKRLPTYEV